MVLPVNAALADFWDLLTHAPGSTFYLNRPATTRMLGSSEELVLQVAPMRWRGTVVVALDRWLDNEADLARVRARSRAGFRFVATSPAVVGQNGLSDVALASSSTPQVISISGLAANEVVPVGFQFSALYGGAQVLHQVVEQATANGSGVTPEFEIEPPLLPGWVVGQALRRNRPILRARIVASTLDQGSFDAVVQSGFRFDWVQSFK